MTHFIQKLAKYHERAHHKAEMPYSIQCIGTLLLGALSLSLGDRSLFRHSGMIRTAPSSPSRVKSSSLQAITHGGQTNIKVEALPADCMTS